MGLASLRQLGSIARVGRALSATMTNSLGVRPPTQLPIAVDFGTGSLKVLQLEPGEPPRLVSAACEPTPKECLTHHESRLEFQTQRLPSLVREAGFKGRRAVCAIPAWATTCKHVQITRPDATTPLDTLVEQAIPLHLNKEPHDVVHRYLTVSAVAEKAGAKVETIIMAVDRELVRRLMAGIAACKLEPVGMHSEFAAALHAFDYVHRRAGDVACNTLYLDIGRGTTTVEISHGKNLAFTRVIDLGGRTLDEAVGQQLDCDIEEAHRIRREPVTSPPSAVMSMAERASGKAAAADLDAMLDRRAAKTAPGFGPHLHAQAEVPLGPNKTDLTEIMEMLADEVRMCLRFHAAQFPEKKVERVVFLGGESRNVGLCQYIAKSLKLPAQMADPMARIARTGKEPCIGVDLSQPQPGWAVAMGLCLGPTDL